MKYWLYLWIIGVPTDGPEPPQEFESQEACQAALQVAYNINQKLAKASKGKKRFGGICMSEDSNTRIQLEWEQDYEGQEAQKDSMW